MCKCYLKYFVFATDNEVHYFTRATQEWYGWNSRDEFRCPLCNDGHQHHIHEQSVAQCDERHQTLPEAQRREGFYTAVRAASKFAKCTPGRERLYAYNSLLEATGGGEVVQAANRPPSTREDKARLKAALRFVVNN